MHTHTPVRRLATACALLAATVAAQAEIVYTENFPNSGSNTFTNLVSWSSYMGNDAADQTNAAVSTGSINSRVFLSNVAGNPNTSTGFLSVLNGTGNGAPLAAAFTTGLNISTSGPVTVNWQLHASGAGGDVRLLVQTGGAWYATSQSFTPNVTGALPTFQSATPADITESFTFTTDASAWRTFDVDPGVSFTLGSPDLEADLAAFPITGIGFYVISSATGLTTRIDTVTVDASAIPEPSAWALMLGVPALALAAGRRRRNR